MLPGQFHASLEASWRSGAEGGQEEGNRGWKEYSRLKVTHTSSDLWKLEGEKLEKQRDCTLLWKTVWRFLKKLKIELPYPHTLPRSVNSNISSLSVGGFW